MSTAPTDNWRDPKYATRPIPTSLPQGVAYEAQVPDTLDLAGQPAELSIKAITSLLEPKYDYDQYAFVEWRTEPPTLKLGDGGRLNLNPKWIEALVLNRLMTGSHVNAEMDGKLIGSIIHVVGMDGLAYEPPEQPGSLYDAFTKERGLPAADMFGEGRMLLAFAVCLQVYDDPIYRELGEKKIQRLLEMAATTEDGALYFRRGRGYSPCEPDADKVPIYTLTDHAAMDPELGMVGTAAAHAMETVVMGASRFYRNTGYEPALELATGLMKYLRDHAKLIDADGKWHGWHFHIVSAMVLATCEYGIAADDRDMLEWARKSYEYGKSIGDPLIGFYAGVPRAEPSDFNPNDAENGHDADRMSVEPCSIADMILIGLHLSRAGVADYYEDVEYAWRNMLIEQQVTDNGFLETYPVEFKNKMLEIWPIDNDMISRDNAAERGLGSFVCSNPNQWHLHDVPGPQACSCCLGNAGRVLYYAWDSIMDESEDELRVNLLLNRASKAADLDSYLPNTGRVVLKMKESRTKVAVRIPSWVNLTEVICQVNGAPANTEWEGPYLTTPPVNPEDVIEVTFPVREQTVYRQLKSDSYFIDVRGFSVVDLRPHAEVTPILQRPNMREAEAGHRKVQRFVPQTKIVW